MLRNIKDLKLWDQNYNEGNVGAIATSIARFGFNNALKEWHGTIMAGNHTVMALWSLKASAAEPPQGVIVQDNDWFIDTERIIDLSHLDEDEATAFAIADNRTAALASQDPVLLAKYLKQALDHSEDLFAATGYDRDDLDELLKQNIAQSKRGNLLDQFNLGDGKARYIVGAGDIFRLSERHVLLCIDPVTDWALMLPHLHGDAMLCLYPSPLLALSDMAEETTLVLVTPDAFCAGHVLDRYIDVYGDVSVRKIS